MKNQCAKHVRKGVVHGNRTVKLGAKTRCMLSIKLCVRNLEYLLLNLGMTTFKVSVPEDKASFFLEVLELIGATYESKENIFELNEEQKRFLLSQNEVPLEDCQSADLVFEELKVKYGL